MITQSNNLDPFYNLAIEEFLLDDETGALPHLLLWQGRNSVVIGKNQNPWQECNLRILAQSDGLLARRVSGGGAVYHDPGNLNCSLITAREVYEPTRLFDLLLSAVASLGIQAKLTNRNCLSVDGRKFSGSAFCLRGNRALHHATLLINSNLNRLHSVFSSPRNNIHTRAIPSVPATVVNLTDLDPSLNTTTIAEAVVRAFVAAYPTAGNYLDPTDMDQTGLGALLSRHTSRAWRFGYTPAFDICITQPFDQTPLRLKLHVNKGIVRECSILATPPGKNSVCTLLESILPGTCFYSKEPANFLRDADGAKDSKLLLGIADQLERLSPADFP